MAVPDDRRTRPQGQQREDHPRPRRRAGAALSSGFVLTSHQEPQPLEKVGLPTPDDLPPALFIDSDSDAVRSLVERVTAGAKDQHDVVARLFAAIRDRKSTRLNSSHLG